MNYAIVDIETTGGSAKKHAVTEVAIIRLDEVGKEIDRYETLINPNVLIPRKITALTGITNEMVNDAPQFHEVAKEIWERTHGHVFVAHNVNFDYGFIREQFSRLCAYWRPKRLCTVRLSRKLFPHFYSYSLGKIAAQMGKVIDDRHRAMGDADFTAYLFRELLTKDTNGQIAFSLNQRSREGTLPPNLDRKKFDRIPSTLGVYIFRGAKDKVIYVGKANDLKKRVAEHFRGNTHTGYKNRFAEKIEDVEWVETPTELLALLTEANLIKKFWPPYNRLLKRVSLNWGIYSYTDQNGYHRFNIGRVGKWDRPVLSFRNRYEARLQLEDLCKKHLLCARYCSLQELSGKCIEDLHGACNGACIGEESPSSYNDRFDLALEELTYSSRSMLIKGKGFREGEESVVLIEKGRYKGHGVVSSTIASSSLDEIKAHIETGYDDQDIQSVIMSNLHRNPASHEVVFFDA